MTRKRTPSKILLVIWNVQNELVYNYINLIRQKNCPDLWNALSNKEKSDYFEEKIYFGGILMKFTITTLTVQRLGTFGSLIPGQNQRCARVCYFILYKVIWVEDSFKIMYKSD